MVFENLIGLSIKNDKKLFTNDKSTVILRGCNINDIDKIITPLDYDISWFLGKYDGYSNESSWHDLMSFERDLKYLIYSSKFDNGVVVHLQNFKTNSQFEKDLLRENVSDCVKKYYLDFLKFLDDRLLTEAVIMLTYLNFRGYTNSTYYVKGNFIEKEDLSFRIRIECAQAILEYDGKNTLILNKYYL
ncbi:hypothetical protein H312_00319 [Anncaliia algerae PRA339]|uniref:Uncharacterized protein n=1 Tax=Anncaliia algerae PRA339 TaxID=1288291 RepID=A0A059F5P6_9MICR|nr:hypothetical protein H312_00319 [Anncaliia algerae PRA339]